MGVGRLGWHDCLDRMCDTLRSDAAGFGLFAFARPGVVG